MLRWGRVLLGAMPLLPEAAAQRLLRRWHPFDLRHGTDTGGLLYAPDLPTGHSSDAFNEGYYATAPSVFRTLIARWEDTLAPAGLRVSDYSFVDLGCGKGRALLLASEFGFRSITGIELNPGLCAAAEQNVRHWRRRRRACPPISVVCGDVLESPLQAPSSPDRPLVLFLFNSFSAEVVRGLLARLTGVGSDAMGQRRQMGPTSRTGQARPAALTRSAPIDLLYVHPDQAALVERTPGVELLADMVIRFSPEDAAADAFGVDVDRCAVYRM